MLAGPQLYADHLTKERYHPRSNKHGIRLAQLVLNDLLATCQPMREAAARGKIVYASNYDVFFSDPSVTAGVPQEVIEDLAWNIDLVIGPVGNTQSQLFPLKPGVIEKGNPKTIWMALDAKGVMTEHGKARRNRQRDATALSAVMHLFHPSVVVGATIPINIARKFKSPTKKKSKGITDHGPNIGKVVSDTLAVFRAVRAVADRIRPDGIEALGCFVVDYQNVRGSKASVVVAPPAPQPGDIIHYDRFVDDLATSLIQRFGSQM